MEKVEFEIFRPIKKAELRELQDLTMKTFSKIGTERSRQRLVYDLLNALKTNNRKRFLWLILKNVNTLKPEDKEKSEFTKFLNDLYIEHETPENFEKVAYTIVMGIMSIDKDERGEENG